MSTDKPNPAAGPWRLVTETEPSTRSNTPTVLVLCVGHKRSMEAYRNGPDWQTSVGRWRISPGDLWAHMPERPGTPSDHSSKGPLLTDEERGRIEDARRYIHSTHDMGRVYCAGLLSIIDRLTTKAADGGTAHG